MDYLRILAVFILVLINGFFVTAEFALVSVRRTRIVELVNQGHASARWVQKVLEDTESVIAATQLGITLASLALGWVGEPALSHLIEPIIALFPPLIQSGVAHSFSATIAFLAITFLHVVVGELAPKSLALQHPERAALVIARPTLWMETLFRPAIWLLNRAGNWVLRSIGLHPAQGHLLVRSVNELKMLVSASAEEGVMDDTEEEMLHAVFDFGSMIVRQVMIPRTEIIAIESDAYLEDVIALATSHPYTKFPAYVQDLDQIIGIVHTKDLLRFLQNPQEEQKTAGQLAREAIFVPETLPVNLLLNQFRAQRQHIAIVVDEFGGTAGLITLEDLLEEIVGEVSDPFDSDRPEIQTHPDGSALVNGLALIEDVNQFFHLNLNTPNYDTIAGYMLEQLDRIPKVGDQVEQNGVRLEVKNMDGLRIAQIKIQILTGDQDATSA